MTTAELQLSCSATLAYLAHFAEFAHLLPPSAHSRLTTYTELAYLLASAGLLSCSVSRAGWIGVMTKQATEALAKSARPSLTPMATQWGSAALSTRPDLAHTATWILLTSLGLRDRSSLAPSYRSTPSLLLGLFQPYPFRVRRKCRPIFAPGNRMKLELQRHNYESVFDHAASSFVP